MRVLVVCPLESQAAVLAEALSSLGHETVFAEAEGAPDKHVPLDLAVVRFGVATVDLARAGIPTLLLPEGAGAECLLAILGRRRKIDLVLRVGDLTIDRARQEVLRAGRLVALTRTQFDLLVALAARAGEAVSAETLALAAWGDAMLPLNTLNAHVKNLRRRLGDTGFDSIIRTHKGFGYALGESEGR